MTTQHRKWVKTYRPTRSTLAKNPPRKILSSTKLHNTKGILQQNRPEGSTCIFMIISLSLQIQSKKFYNN